MFTMVMQTLDLIVNGRLHPFFIYFIVVWAMFLIALLAATQHKNIKSTWTGTISIVVPTRGETAELTERCVQSLLGQTKKANEIIFVIDPSDIERGIPEVLSRLGVKYLVDTGGNKRTAFAIGARATSNTDILMMLAGDCIYPRDFNEKAIMPFADPKVGGVATNQRVLDANKTFARRVADWMYDYRYKIAYSMMGWRGVVVCLTGESFVCRRSLIINELDGFLNETFMGRLCIPGDDRYLTSRILQQGYKTVYQKLAKPVLVDAPDTLGGLIRQQLRWMRTSQKYTFQTLKWMWGKSLMLPFHLARMYLTLYAFIAITIWGIINVILKIDPIVVAGNNPLFLFPWIIFWFLIGLFVSQGIMQMVHLWDNPKDWAIFPAYVILKIFVFIPVTLYALFTMKKTGWLIRGKNSV